MPSFKAILPFWRHQGSKSGAASLIRTRPLPKAILLGARHELMFDAVMEDGDRRQPRPLRPRRPVLG